MPQGNEEKKKASVCGRSVAFPSPCDGASRAPGYPPAQKKEMGSSPNPLYIHIFYERNDYLRKRNKTLTIRLTEKEHDAVMEKVAKAGMNMTEYLLASALNTEIYVAEDTKPLVAELKRIGNNLNQITTKINAGVFTSYNFWEVITLQRAIYSEVRRIGRSD